MRKTIVSLCLCIFLTLPSLSNAAEDFDPGELNAVLLADYETGDIIYSENLKRRIEVASITKIMTYLVAMDEVTKGVVNLDDQVTISEKAARRGGSSFKLKAGQVHSLDSLLESSMVASANDACIAIAQHVSGDEKTFTRLMNDKARELEMDRSYFVSVNGFPEEGTHNTMSVEDILKLTVYTINKYPEILRTTSKKTLVDKERGLEFRNTNPLLGQIKGITGFKTGYADQAGYCLVSTKVSDDSQLIGIVMGAGNKSIRASKSKELLEGKLSNKFKRKKVLDKDIIIDEVTIPGSANGKIEVYVENDMYGMIENEESISRVVNIYNYPDFPVEQGEPVGEITVQYNNNTKTMDLIAKEDIKQGGIINTAVFAIKSLIASVF